MKKATSKLKGAITSLNKVLELIEKCEADGPGQPPKYPFRGMQVGDSIARPVEDAKRLRAAATAYCKYHGLDWEFKTSRVKGKVIIERVK